MKHSLSCAENILSNWCLGPALDVKPTALHLHRASTAPCARGSEQSILCWKCKKAACCVSAAADLPALWFLAKDLDQLLMVTHCQVSRQVTTMQKKSPRLSQKAQRRFTTQMAFAKINWTLQTEIDACSLTLISCTLEPIRILKASPMKSSYTAAIIKMIFYLQGPKAMLNHEPVSEQGTPSLRAKCMKWKYSQGLGWISIYPPCDPALQFSAPWTLPPGRAGGCSGQLGVLVGSCCCRSFSCLANETAPKHKPSRVLRHLLKPLPSLLLQGRQLGCNVQPRPAALPILPPPRPLSSLDSALAGSIPSSNDSPVNRLSKGAG